MRHEMKLNNSPFVSIKNKTKTIELRLNDDKRQKINVGDEIEFINNMTSEKLLVDVRTLIMDTKIARKQEKAYSLLINIIDDYNLRLLSTKIYWDKLADREAYKKFWNAYKNIMQIKESDYITYSKEKEKLFLKRELREVFKNENRYYRIIKFYKRKLVALGEMRELKNSCISEGYYTKKKTEDISIKEKVI